MKLHIKVKSSISILETEVKGIIPSEEEANLFSKPMSMEDETTAELNNFGEVMELSYLERDVETGTYYQRTLRYDKVASLLTISREDQDNKIEIQKNALLQNTYQIDDVGEMELETYGITMEWSSPKTDIVFVYYSKLGGAWTRLTIEITGNEVE